MADFGRTLSRTLRGRWGRGLVVGLVIAAAIVAGIDNYARARADRQQVLAAALDGTVRVSIDMVQKWLFERLADTEVAADIAGDLTPANFIPRFRNSLDGLFDQMAGRYLYQSVGAYSTETGQRIAGSKAAPAILPDWLEPRIRQATNLRVGQLTFYPGPEGADAGTRRLARQLVFFRGVFSAATADKPFAIVVLTVPGAMLDAVVTRDAVGATGRGAVYFARNDAGRVSSPQATDAPGDAGLARLRDMRAAASVEARILAGAIGMLEGPDINGHQVFAVGRRVEPYSTFVIASLDVRDGMGEFERHALSLAGLGTAGIALAIAAGLLWRRAELYRARLREAAIAGRLEFATSRADDAILVIDDEGMIVDANERAMAMYGRRRDQLVGMAVAELRSPAERVDLATLAQGLESGDDLSYQTVHQRQDGTPFPVAVIVARMRSGGRTQFNAIVRDLTQAQETARRIEHLQHFDPVTGLAARQRLIDDLGAALAAGQACPIAVIGIDRLHHFAQALGYTAGDALAVEVSRRLAQCCGPAMQAYRFGPDEFVLAMPDGTSADIDAAAGQALQALAQPFVVETRALHLAACIGIAAGPQDGADPVTLLRNGQSALHAARAGGQGQIAAYRPAMSRARLDDLALEERLRGAIGRGEMSLHYQPQISLQTGRIIGAEALLRWQHPELGAVPPSRFIPLAEETGLIQELGAWVLDEACRHWRDWRAAGAGPPPVAVNLAAPQFQRPGFARSVIDLLAAHEMPSAALQLEITESMVMGDVEAAIAVMQELTRAGIDLAIDDFGTGYSSLSHLQRFPVAKLKIDRSFVLHCDRQPGDAAIVGAVIAMARSMNLRVIAEGVETEGQRAVLRDLGCDEMQGYLFSRPLPADAYAALLTSSSPAR